MEHDFEEKATQAIPGDVRMISGCADEQTSADVSNVASFGLPPDAGPGGAGGACTNALLASLENNPNPSWIELLTDMRTILSDKGYTQIPQMSSSRKMDLAGAYEIQSEGGGSQKALLVGINYIGQQGELSGCCNDVTAMKIMLEGQGFSDFRVLRDDGEGDGMPDTQNILEGFKWLMEGAQAGDSLFFHYSGHGGSLRCEDGSEADGKDETIIPLDYRTAGQIRDNVLMQSLVLPCPAGCQLTAVMDCCHSGTVFDLPYTFTADDAGLEVANDNINNGGSAPIPINTSFNMKFALKLAQQMFEAFQSGGPEAALSIGLNGFLENGGMNFAMNKFGSFAGF